MSSLPSPAHPDLQAAETAAPEPSDETLPEEQQERQLRLSLFEAFSKIPDPRKKRGVKFSFPALLSIMLVGILAGCKNTVQIENFIRLRPHLLPLLGVRPYVRKVPGRPPDACPSPDSDTMITNLKLIDPDLMVEVLADWVNAQIGTAPRAVAAVDGKALRGTGEHMLTVFVGQLHLAVWQKEVGDKENEFSSLVKSLDELFSKYPALRILTGDAMFCEKEVARKIVEKRRHYFLQLDSPHKSDVKTAETVFGQRMNLPPEASSEPEKKTKAGPVHRHA